MSNVLLGIILGLWSGVSMVLALSGIGVRTTLITGVLAGLCVGNVPMGFQIGATCLLMSIGFYTYGGATIPDWITGAMFGTVIAAKTGDYNTGLTTAVALAALMSQMDILGRATTTVFQHLGEKALAENNIPKFERVTLMGVLPWALSRMLPVLLGMIMIDNVVALADFANSIQWVANGLAVVGKVLPAVGFALLLSYMDLTKFWPFLILGFVLYAYAGMGTLALALVGLAAAGLFLGVGGAK
ncbi:MAG: PTS sugar transporter subunit IIC [Erysipelotrichaceae bacterium]|nr:PTS sugar transporter subunit IIC [Erysipelotrichaceae bacterium]MBO4537714.1 PTS sugar transporter subunit IIC [Erysipelotrichaceae bacterium]MBR5049624.1 PTS sugar transporter subunit IIC [Erysipelotrichaceae bacterium]